MTVGPWSNSVIVCLLSKMAAGTDSQTPQDLTWLSFYSKSIKLQLREITLKNNSSRLVKDISHFQFSLPKAITSSPNNEILVFHFQPQKNSLPTAP